MTRLRRERKAAQDLYRDFREAEPGASRLVPIEWPKALTVMGRAVGIAYLTTHGGKVTPYFHEFSPRARPLLCAGAKRGQVFLIGKRFKVDGHGIVDIDASGRRVPYTPTLELVRRRRRGKGG